MIFLAENNDSFCNREAFFMVHVTQIGFNFIHFGGLDVRRPEGEDQYLLIFFRSDAEVLLNGVYEPVKRSSFFIYPKGVPQFYRKTDGDYYNDWMYFDITPDDGYFQKLGIPLCTPIRLRNPSPLNTMMMDMFNDYYFENAQDSEALADKANSFFHRLGVSCALEQAPLSQRSVYLNELSDLRSKLLNFSFLPQSSVTIAKALHMSVSGLEHTYKALFQSTIAQDAIRGRIHYACMLLQNTDYPVSNIAFICGYETQEHFSRQFKRIMGLPPRQYRLAKRREEAEAASKSL